MIPTAVRRAKVPPYPTREEVLADPSLLEKHVPEGWRLSAEITRAVALFLAASLAACEPGEKPVVKKTPAAIVAPVFQHGEGRGAMGCVVVSPPVFLSEEEAMGLIAEELGKEGVTLSERDVVWKDLVIPARREDWSKVGSGGRIETVVDPRRESALKVDGYDPGRRIGIEFVSRKEFADLGGPMSGTTVQGYDLKEVAGWVARQVREKGKGGIYFGAFYDPLSRKDPPDVDKEKDWEKHWRKLEEGRKEDSLKLLRLQVQDFVGWLKAVGAL